MRSLEEWLCSEETGLPFSHCVSCRWPLLEIDAPWLVNKDFHRGECVLEYAVCQPCRDDVASRMPEESKAAVRRFLETEINWEERLEKFMMSPDATERFTECVCCLTPREEMEGFGISAMMDSGGVPVIGPLPLLMCKSCIARVSAMLSDQGRDVWRQFLAEHFTGPPDDSGLGIF